MHSMQCIGRITETPSPTLLLYDQDQAGGLSVSSDSASGWPAKRSNTSTMVAISMGKKLQQAAADLREDQESG